MRRAALYGELEKIGAQVWMTGADAAQFAEITRARRDVRGFAWTGRAANAGQLPVMTPTLVSLQHNGERHARRLLRENGPAREVLRVAEVELPQPGPGEVRVKLMTSGVNPSDVKSRAGINPQDRLPARDPA